MLIDKAKGAKREVVGTKLGQPGYSLADNGRTNEVYGDLHHPAAECAITAPATAVAKWTGWAKALSPPGNRSSGDEAAGRHDCPQRPYLGRGGLNIEATRISTESTVRPPPRWIA